MFSRKWILAAVLVALVVPQVASAKFPMERVTIDGDEVAVADPGEDLAFSPWGGEFLTLDGEALGGALETTPTDLPASEPYAVQFWADVEGTGDASVVYGFEYYPGNPGYIRLPERGEEQWERNQATIARPTGWYHASPEWEGFVDTRLADESTSTARWLVVPAIALGAIATAGIGLVVTRRRWS